MGSEMVTMSDTGESGESPDSASTDDEATLCQQATPTEAGHRDDQWEREDF
jgi:hypothetical protein